MLHEKVVDRRLRVRRVPRPLADIDQLGARPRFDQELASNQAVVHHDIGPAEQLQAANGDEAGVAGTATDQVNLGRFPAGIRR